jgi:hypothetical protein
MLISCGYINGARDGVQNWYFCRVTDKCFFNYHIDKMIAAWVRQKTTRLGVYELEYLPTPPHGALEVCFEGQQKLQVPHCFMAEAAKVCCSLFYWLNFPNL